MWTTLKALSLAEMESMAHEIFEALPARFRELCEGVIIRTDDFPTDEILDEMDAESEFDLLGLFQGTGVPFRSHDDIARLPNMVWLYRRPILDYWAEHEEALGDLVIISDFRMTTWPTSRRRPRPRLKSRRRQRPKPIKPLSAALFAINY